MNISNLNPEVKQQLFILSNKLASQYEIMQQIILNQINELEKSKADLNMPKTNLPTPD